MKRCSKCKERKPLEAFHHDWGRPDGRQGICKECRKGSYVDNGERGGYLSIRREIIAKRQRYEEEIEARKFVVLGRDKEFQDKQNEKLDALRRRYGSLRHA
jgi:hypothetical protein